jgi:hypothetical protein
LPGRSASYAPPLQALFQTEALPLAFWPPLLVAGVAFFLVVGAEKSVLRARRSSQDNPTLAPSGI